MNVSVTGFDGPLARATRAELERRGHTVTATGGECVVHFPGDPVGFADPRQPLARPER